VPTPLSRDNQPVLDHVNAAARSIAPHLQRGNLIILESTSPVGTTEQVSRQLARLRPDLSFPMAGSEGGEADIAVAYCPERVLPGRVLKELVENDRCVGGVSRTCARRARRFYEGFVRGACIETTARTAEMAKLAENSFRDLNIAFANELSMICEAAGIDVWELIELANRHPRVDILKPGPGVGGHCIAVDPWFLVDAAPERARLVRTARQVNDQKADFVYDQIRALIDRYPDRPVSCLGLSFKANVDDLRESPAIEIAERLAGEFGARVRIVEPFIKALPERLDRLGARLQSLDQAIADEGILVLLVDHEAFGKVDPRRRARCIAYDCRGIWSVPAPGLAGAMEKRSAAA
jgi:UDP-N-acetyl-D-mannosaminuronic acid dehydrogenase